jgi:sulfonate transport system substrate-binding protein
MRGRSIGRRRFLAATGTVLAWRLVPGRRRAAAQARLGPVRLGYNANLYGSLSVIALQEKLFDRFGVAVDGRRFAAGRQIRDAMVAGQIDMGTFGADTFIIGATKGDLVAIAMLAHAGRTAHIIVRPDSDIKSVADLKGKTVAGILGGSIYTIFETRLAPRNGLPKGSYRAVNVLGPDQLSALATKQVDAVAAVEPYVSIGEEQGVARSIASYETVDLTPFLLCARPEFVDRNRAATVAFLRGWVAAARVVQAEPDRAVTIMLAAYREQGYDLNKATMARALGRLDVRTDFAPELPAYLAQEAQEMLREKKIGAPPDWGKALRGEFLAEAKKG